MTARALPAVVVVHDPHGDVVVPSRRGVHDGVLVVRARPGTRATPWLTTALLDALGVDLHGPGKPKHPQDDEITVAAWLAAYPVTDVVVGATENVPSSLLPDLVRIVTAGGARVWLITSNRSTRIAAEEQWCDPRPVTWWHEHHPVSDTPADDTRGTPPPLFPPEVPGVAFPQFRAHCARVLPAEHAQQVDRHYGSVLTDALGVLTPANSDEHMHAWLAQRCSSCRTTSELVVTVRAAQAAACRNGLDLKVDLDRLRVYGPISSGDATAQPWRDLRCYRQPWRAAAVALAATNVPVHGISTMTVGDINADGTTTAGDAHPESLVYLRAQRHLRTLDSAAPTDPLFAHPGGTPIRARAIADAITTAARDTGMHVTAQYQRRATGRGARWRHRNGYTLVRFT